MLITATLLSLGLAGCPALSIPTTGAAINSKPKSAVGDHATAGQNHPTASATLTIVTITITLGPAISTKPASDVMAVVLV